MNETKGVYVCTFCGGGAGRGSTIAVAEKPFMLGNAEIWIPATDGKTYVAPEYQAVYAVSADTVDTLAVSGWEW